MQPHKMNQEQQSIRRQLAAAAALCSLGFAHNVAAQEAGPRPVPVDQSAYHVPVFRNEYVNVLRVNIPAKRTTDYHIHSNDQACVVVEDYPPEAYSQPLGGPPGQPRGAARGETTYISYFNKPLTHRAVNPGTLPRHSVCAELNAAKPHGFTSAAREVAGYTQLLDNERLRAWRLILKPGQIAPEITQNPPGLRVVVNGGEIEELAPGKQVRGIMLRQGDFYWQQPGAIRAVRNIDTTAVELVEFELR